MIKDEIKDSITHERIVVLKKLAICVVHVSSVYGEIMMFPELGAEDSNELVCAVCW